MKEITKSQNIIDIINWAKEQDHEQFIWCFGLIETELYSIKILGFIKDRNELLIKPLEIHFNEVVDHATVHDQLNFYIPHNSVLFRCNVKKVDQDGKIRLEIPEVLVQENRRQNIRQDIDSYIPLRLNFIAKYRFDKYCHDLSLNGASFIIRPSEKTYLKVGDELTDLVLILDKEKFKIKGIIKNILKVKPGSKKDFLYHSLKVGIEFQHSEKSLKMIQLLLDKLYHTKNKSTKNAF